MKTSLMRVVSDANVLIHLAKLGRLPVLRDLYERVEIPEYVRQEITSKEDHGITDAIVLLGTEPLFISSVLSPGKAGTTPDFPSVFEKGEQLPMCGRARSCNPAGVNPAPEGRPSTG